MKNITIADFNKICRICLIENNFDLLLTMSSEIHLLLKEIERSTVQKMYEEMPQKICTDCLIQLKSAYNFIQKCTESTNILIKVLQEKNKTIVEENFNCSGTLEQCDINKESECNSNVSVVSPPSFERFHGEIEEKQTEECIVDKNGRDLMKIKMRRSLAALLIEKYDIYNLTCNICRKEFKLRSSLLRHLEIHKTNRPVYRCTICEDSKKLYTEENLLQHQRLHRIKPKYECEKCFKKFTLMSKLLKHFKTIHVTEELSCDQCSAKFYHYLQLKKHEQTHIEKKYICDICGKEFPKKNYLTKHRKNHSEDRPWVCSTCHKNFKTKAVLQQHTKIYHIEAETKEVCHICGKIIPYVGFQAHLVTHKNLQLKCSKCDKIFKTKTNLKAHLKYKHKHGLVNEILYYCKICNKSHQTKGYLNAHMKKTHTDNPHICNLCGKSYKSFSNVRSHIRTAHLDFRPHECEVCHKKFHTKTLLKNHVRIHSNERPFVCTVCKKTFRFKNVLETHAKKVHS